ncbi:MAG: DHHW family protein [Firmicutes bacterium]|nr:DHHW family protein [Bacillota bacterium]
MKQHKNMVVICTIALFFLTMSLLCLTKKAAPYSDSERRKLAQFPETSANRLISGQWMKDFEAYSLDQFPFRDSFRTLKAVSTFYVFGQSDCNGIYLTDGYACELEYPLKEEMLQNAADKFSFLYETYLKETDTSLYFSIIPDKNYFLAASGGYPSMDYDSLFHFMTEQTPYMEFVDLRPFLSIEDYYRTDTHWKQEALPDIASVLMTAMSTPADSISDTSVNTLSKPFYGVYYGHSALPLSGEPLSYLTSPSMNQYIVTSYSSGKPEKKFLYDMDKAYGKDPYEMFLSGSEALITIENPDAATQKELVIFRDSFASSLAPLLASGYSKITLIDIRYMQSSAIGQFVRFTDQDVLFLYSTLVLNNSTALR